MNQEKIGQYIRNLRKNNHLSQVQFAEILGVTPQAVSKWENGKNLPDMAILKDISEKFNIDIDEIINGESKKTKKSKKPWKKIIILIFIILIIIIFILGIFRFTKSASSYEFNEVSTTNNDFSISGSVVISNHRTSLIINQVNYRGRENDEVYQTLSCTLYEEIDNQKTEISSCESNSNQTLKEYLENVKIKMDHYSNHCTMFTTSDIFLEIEVIDQDNQTIIYKIPININKEDCD